MKNNNYGTGYVYILSNKSMPGLVKIGLTTRLPEDRSNELFKTSIPTPFEVSFRIATSHPKEVEKKSHSLLSDCRVNPNREFFEISVEGAIEAVRHSAIEMSGINSWSSGSVQNLNENDRVTLSLETGQVFALISFSNIFSNQAEIIDLWQVHSNCDQLELHCVDSTTKTSSFSSNHPFSESDPVPYLDRENKVMNGMINGREVLVAGDRLVWIPTVNDRTNQQGVIFEACGAVQVISRTWSPVIGSHGIPLILNDFNYESVWPEAKKAVDRALKLGVPRTWAPRNNRGDEWTEFGTDPQPAEYWLPQLSRRKNNVKNRKTKLCT
ncbi:hypothetical protein OLEAN_C07790 [Oleispira antarctica RB-8]|uniref:Bacteriophage T5 Orf172 DNA-binding domain-containing protein n=1 Tax=Oleispira antarctica RB-8 TaxID=698738 RepID=R4YKV1_OLEAN|nr:hypothetical protein OLEAN_C07790 [Oleispira antarctica RB-8]